MRVSSACLAFFQRLGLVVLQDPVHLLAGHLQRIAVFSIRADLVGDGRASCELAHVLAGVFLGQEMSAGPNRLDRPPAPGFRADLHRHQVVARPVVDVGIQDELFGIEQGIGLGQPHAGDDLRPGQADQERIQGHLRRRLPGAGRGGIGAVSSRPGEGILQWCAISTTA